jgi:hypothetical protein
MTEVDKAVKAQLAARDAEIARLTSEVSENKELYEMAYANTEAFKAKVARLTAELAKYKEICICAAIKYEGGIVRGYRHGDCFNTMQAKGIKRTGDEIQGFITSRNRFVDRAEGRRLQAEAGIESAAEGGYEYDDCLFSEDLY